MYELAIGDLACRPCHQETLEIYNPTACHPTSRAAGKTFRSPVKPAQGEASRFVSFRNAFFFFAIHQGRLPLTGDRGAEGTFIPGRSATGATS